MAAAAEREGLGAVEGLEALLDGLAGVRVVDVDGDVHLDAAEGVHDALEVVEVDLGVVGDGHVCEPAHHLHGVGRPAEGVGGVDLLLAVLAEVHQGVAVQRHEGDLLVLGVDAGQHDGVGAVVGGVLAVLGAPGALLGLVHAQEQHVERVPRLGGGEGAAELLVDAAVEAPLDVGEVRPRAHGAQRHDAHDDEREDLEAFGAAAPPAPLGVKAGGVLSGEVCRVLGGRSGLLL